MTPTNKAIVEAILALSISSLSVPLLAAASSLANLIPFSMAVPVMMLTTANEPGGKWYVFKCMFLELNNVTCTNFALHLTHFYTHSCYLDFFLNRLLLHHINQFFKLVCLLIN